MFKNADELRTSLSSLSPDFFVSQYIFEPIPHLFSNDLVLWIEWKTKFARMLAVDPFDVIITGSAATGFSLNPYKRLKEFDDHSDVDCGIVSEHYFNIAWHYLRSQQPFWLSLPGRTREAIRQHRRNYVFSGTIAADRMLGVLPFGKDWLNALEEMGAVPPTYGRDVKLRIYKDYNALRTYQINGIKRIRDEALAQVTDEEQEISSELDGTDEGGSAVRTDVAGPVDEVE